MGLDMYLQRVETNGYSLSTIRAADAFLGYEEYIRNFRPKTNGEQPYTLEQWRNGAAQTVDPKVAEAFRPFYLKRYYTWDTKRRYPYASLFEPVGYWRKANCIHNWFVQNVQNGIDDCDAYEVAEPQLRALNDVCAAVLANAIMMPGIVHNGDVAKDGILHPILEEGNVVINPEICQDILPVKDGFFFGSNEYDEYYIRMVEYTFHLTSKLLSQTDFTRQTIIYQSSW